MQQFVLIRVTKNTNVYDGLLREGDFILGPSSTISVLVNHSSSWNSTIDELQNCRAGHIRFHFFESANLAGFRRSLVSKESALEFIKKYGINLSSQKYYEKPQLGVSNSAINQLVQNFAYFYHYLKQW